MQRRVGAFGVLILLAIPLLLQCAGLLHARMLVWGDELWPGYATMRVECRDQEPPAPPKSTAPAAVAKRRGAKAAAARKTEKSNELIDDLLGDDFLDDDDDDTGAKPAPGAPAGDQAGGDGELVDELLDDDEDEELEAAVPPTAAATANEAPSGALAGNSGVSDETADADKPSGEAGSALADDDDDLLADLDKPIADAPPAPPADAATGGAAGQGQGTSGVAGAGGAKAPLKLTTSQRTYCELERDVAGLSLIGVKWTPVLMALLLLFCALIATARREHICLRAARTAHEDRVSNAVQLIANLVVGYSTFKMRAIQQGNYELMHTAWTAGMGLLCVINLAYMLKPMRAPERPSSVGRALAAIPLYAWMAVVSGLYFLVFREETYPEGIANYLQKLTETSILYIQVGLYLWAGMLLRDTRIGQLLFDIVRPLKLPPELLAVAVVILAAIPTAYSGASGILVLALGATIYTELRRSGASQQRALAATAMSGSLGVVLSPCLLVVVVASINKYVVTDDLFAWGWAVFGLTSMLFMLISFTMRSSSWRISVPDGAGSDALQAARGVVPYVALGVGVILFFRLGLNAGLDEMTAPYVLPVALLAVMPWDRIAAKRASPETRGPRRETSLDTGTHIGALLMLMGMSVCFGGVIERSEIVELFPHDMGGPLGAMAVLTVVLVIIGMIMDPYGAVILVNVTLFPIAQQNGIHPINFWMTALVSFELGYLTPPVALNHLLTRQVVQHLPEFDEDEVPDPSLGFFRRHERLTVPIAVMVTTLLIVSLGPILLGIRADG